MSIKSVFDKYSKEYDGARRRLIPCFDDFYKIAINTIPFAGEKSIRVLDLGAGTGLLSEMVAAAFPESEIILIDISAEMLAVAKTRLKTFRNKISYIENDYTKREMPGKFDAIISSLSIHHLDGSDKKTLFGNCYQSLVPGGIFINADQVAGETPDIEKTYRQKWLAEAGNNGATEDELKAALERMKEDKMSTLSYQLTCLKEAGFSDVNCWYRNDSFVVFSGTKK
ncbi:MAG: class I SAM-dependent methyltransferase [Pseudomonadota bacterium]